MGISYFIMLVLTLCALIALAAADNRIINGDDVTSTSTAPWQVSLQKQGSHSCGGSLIGSKYVMSACHCKQSSGVVAVMGTLEWQEPNISIRGSMECHPNWNSNKMDYDFSIMTLYADVDATNPDIAIIPVASKQYPAGTIGQITGWGQTTHVNGHRADVLQVAYTPLVDIQSCRQQWGITKITERMQCVGGNGVNSGCKGDSGGPLAVQDPEDGIWYLVGNTSWGPPACQADQYGVWSNNVAVYQWINFTISQ